MLDKDQKHNKIKHFTLVAHALNCPVFSFLVIWIVRSISKATALQKLRQTLHSLRLYARGQYL